MDNKNDLDLIPAGRYAKLIEDNKPVVIGGISWYPPEFIINKVGEVVGQKITNSTGEVFTRGRVAGEWTPWGEEIL